MGRIHGYAEEMLPHVQTVPCEHSVEAEKVAVLRGSGGVRNLRRSARGALLIAGRTVQSRPKMCVVVLEKMSTWKRVSSANLQMKNGLTVVGL